MVKKKTDDFDDGWLDITGPELRQIVQISKKLEASASRTNKAKPAKAKTQVFDGTTVQYAVTRQMGNTRSPVMLTLSFTPDPKQINAIKTVPIRDINATIDNALKNGGEWQASFKRNCLVQYHDDEPDLEEEEVIPCSIDLVALENGVSISIHSEIFSVAALYRNKVNRFETFVYRDLESDESERKPKRPRDKWPDPKKPRYANVNRNDERHDTRIEASTARRLEAFLEETGKTKKAATDEALNRLIDAYELEHGVKFGTDEPE